jgi:hypothetical protein
MNPYIILLFVSAVVGLSVDFLVLWRLCRQEQSQSMAAKAGAYLLFRSGIWIIRDIVPGYDYGWPGGIVYVLKQGHQTVNFWTMRCHPNLSSGSCGELKVGDGVKFDIIDHPEGYAFDPSPDGTFGGFGHGTYEPKTTQDKEISFYLKMIGCSEAEIISPALLLIYISYMIYIV